MKSMFFVVVFALLFAPGVKAGGPVTISGRTVGEVVTMVGTINRGSCGGGMGSEKIKRVGVSVYEANYPRGAGPYVDVSGAKVSVLVNGRSIPGVVTDRTYKQDVYLEFIPSEALYMSDQDTAKITTTGLRIIRAGYAKLDAVFIQEINGNQCFGTDNVYVTFSGQSSPTKPPTSTPTPDRNTLAPSPTATPVVTLVPTNTSTPTIAITTPTIQIKPRNGNVDKGEAWWKKILRNLRIIN